MTALPPWHPALERPRPSLLFEPVLPAARPARRALLPAMAFEVPDFDAPPPPPGPDPQELAEAALQARLAAAREAGFADTGHIGTPAAGLLGGGVFSPLFGWVGARLASAGAPPGLAEDPRGALIGSRFPSQSWLPSLFLPTL